MGDKAADDHEWPIKTQEKYERLETIGKGSFGKVWLCRRSGPAESKYDDEFVAIKNILTKTDKMQVYAEREIEILGELRHPNIIRLVQAYKVHENVRVVVMQLARGPNLNQVVQCGGCLGLPLSRLVSRQLVNAVSYLHGRAVIHRDIKPANCILAINNCPATEEYDWQSDDAIWSDKQDAVDAVNENRWKLMLVDFGFARALEQDEVSPDRGAKRLRNSIVFESKGERKSTARALLANQVPLVVKEEEETEGEEVDGAAGGRSSSTTDDMEAKLAAQAAMSMRQATFEPTNNAEAAVMHERNCNETRPRLSFVSIMPDFDPSGSPNNGRKSLAHRPVRSMSALGTKAYAAPEIRKKLRRKTDEDIQKENAAMSECVADYGMIVDAYSVGWTIRVAISGVPPSYTISAYMKQAPDGVHIRDPNEIPQEAAELITNLTQKKAEDRMTVREAQNEPYIAGGIDSDDEKYKAPEGDYPSQHGDPVVPLKCGPELSKLTIQYHMH